MFNCRSRDYPLDTLLETEYVHRAILAVLSEARELSLDC